MADKRPQNVNLTKPNLTKPNLTKPNLTIKETNKEIDNLDDLKKVLRGQ